MTSVRLWPLGLLLLLSLAARVGSFSDLYDNAQPGPIAHIIDIVEHGRWLMQREPSGELATKPPLYPWLGAISVHVIGRTDEWVFKLPIVLSFLVATWFVFDLGRQALGASGGLMAAVLWVANYHAFKLMYTARTDMLATCFVIAALWCVQKLRLTYDRRGLIAGFWLCVGLALLTKGPPALLAVAWLAIALWQDRAWKRCRPAWQIGGLIVAAAMFLAWLGPVIDAYPQWLDNINREVVERTTGAGSGAHRHTPFYHVPLFFLGRFAPWSVLCVLAVFTFRAWPTALRDKVRWAWWWIGLVLIVFMIPKGKRADYIVPAYAGGAVLAAAMIEYARAHATRQHLWVGTILGGVGVAGIASAIAAGLHLPGPIQVDPDGAVIESIVARIVMIAAGALALIAGGVNLAMADRDQYAAKAIAASFVVIGLLGVYQTGFAPAAQSRAGDYINHVAERAADLDLPMVFVDVGKTPVQALLRNNDMMAESSIDQANAGVALIISERAWRSHRDRLHDRSQVLVRTPRLPESETALLLVRVDRIAAPSP